MLLTTLTVSAQSDPKKVVVTGARFAYPLIQKWIDDYKKQNPAVDIRIEPRTTEDPSSYDLLVEAYEPSSEQKSSREYLSFARYLLLPFGNSHSQFVQSFAIKGLNTDLIKQIYFYDVFADQDKQTEINEQFTVYTRLQKSGAAISFAKHYGFSQEQIDGKAIAGADEHLIKAVLKDHQAISYAPAPLLYDLRSRNTIEGITILPVDADGNKRVSEKELFYRSIDEVIGAIEEHSYDNLPSEHLHLSIPKHNYSTDALKFLRWVIYNSQDDLHQFGYLKPDHARFQKEKEKFEELASR